MVYINKPIFKNLKEISDKIIRNIYIEAIQKINFNQIKCCQKSGGSFCIHGYYCRHLKIKGELLNISIVRIKCEYCGKTHAIFFNDFIPYSIFNTYEGQKILMNDIDEEFSYEVIERMKRIKIKIMTKLSIMGLRIDYDVPTLLEESIHFNHAHFLQIHRGKIVSILSETG